MEPKESPLSQISGTYLRTIYNHDESSWSIVELADKKKNVFIACGHLVTQPLVGETLTMRGDWSRFRNRGRTFAFSDYRAVAPRDQSYFTHYLSALGQIPLDSSKMVVDKFGTDTLIVLSRSPERLSEIQGFQQSHRDRLTSNWRALRKNDHLADELVNSGLNPDLIAELSYRLPPEVDAKQVIADDPWMIYLFTDSSFVLVKEYVASTGAIEVGHYVEAAIVAVCRRALNQGTVAVDLADVQKIAPRLLGLSKPIPAERLEQGVAWLVDEELVNRKGQGLILADIQQSHASISTRLRILLEAENEVTDQLTAKQLAHILKSHPQIEHLVPELDCLQQGLQSKVAFFQSSNIMMEDLFERIIDGLQSALHFDVLKISADSLARPKPAMHPTSILGYKPFGPPERNLASPFEAEMVVIFRAHLLSSNEFKALLEACDADAVVFLVGNSHSTSLHVAGAPLSSVVDMIPTVDLDDLCRNSGDRGLKQIRELITGSWDPMSYEESLDLKLITIECPDDEIPQTVNEVCYGELPESLGIQSNIDTRIIVPVPTKQQTKSVYSEIESRIEQSRSATTGLQPAILKAPIPRLQLPLYLVGQLERLSDEQASFHLRDKSVTLHGSETRLAGIAILIQMAHAQQVHAPLVVVPLTSTETITNEQLLCAMNCSSGWTFLIGSSQNVVSSDLRSISYEL